MFRPVSVGGAVFARFIMRTRSMNFTIILSNMEINSPKKKRAYLAGHASLLRVGTMRVATALAAAGAGAHAAWRVQALPARGVGAVLEHTGARGGRVLVRRRRRGVTQF